MRRLCVGADELLYSERDRGVAEVLARALPVIRARAEALVGITAPSIRIIVTAQAPSLPEWIRPTAILAIVAAAALVGLLLWLGVVFGMAQAGMPGVAAVSLAGVVLFPAGVALLGLPLALRRRVRLAWLYVGGISFQVPSLIKPVIVLRWPPPQRPMVSERLTYARPSPDDTGRYFLAHEYGHLLLYHHYRRRPPLWFNEGFAYWLSEQLSGTPVWRPESRECAREPEPARDAREAVTDLEGYYRLMARYYWEVRSLADTGQLAQALAGPVSAIDRRRPSTSTVLGTASLTPNG